MEQQNQLCQHCKKNQVTPPNILCDECYGIETQSPTPTQKDTTNISMCPVCGYVMGPFDMECARCQRIAHNQQPGVNHEPPPNVDIAPSNTSLDIEASIQGWSWGGFSLTWIWAIFHQVWPGLIALVPFTTPVVAVWLGMQGHRLAWERRNFASTSEFRRVMFTWDSIGFAVFLLSICAPFSFLGFTLLIGYQGLLYRLLIGSLLLLIPLSAAGVAWVLWQRRWAPQS